MSPLVSIITVNYYSDEEILRSYSSVEKLCKDVAIEFILVSNSPLKQEFRTQFEKFSNPIKTIVTGKNLGFSKACNIGAKEASGDYYFFLNPDTTFRNNVVNELITFHKSYNKESIIGPKTLSSSGKKFASVKNHLSTGYFLYLAFPLLKPILPKKAIGGHFHLSESQEVPVLNGHALFMSAALFDELSGFEEKFFMFWEENDLCYRAHQRGYKVLYCDQAELVHKAGTSTAPYFLEMEIEKHRSQKNFILLHHPQWNSLNRISGVIGYFWRAIASLFTFKRKKILQFWKLFSWYTFKYN